MLLSDYEINENTLAILPLSEKTSKVIEVNKEFLINRNPTQIIDESCKFFGSSYVGRKAGTKSLLGMNYKLPVIIEETMDLIFFPTSSPRFDNCSWISLNKIEEYKEKNNSTIINFQNNKNIELDISYSSLQNQILRASRLETILRKRKLK